MSLATVGSPPAQTAASGWYSTSAYFTQRYVEGELVTLPASTVHAKRMGTLNAACGAWTYSWRSMLDLRFPPGRDAAPNVEVCRECLVQVIKEW